MNSIRSTITFVVSLLLAFVVGYFFHGSQPVEKVIEYVEQSPLPPDTIYLPIKTEITKLDTAETSKLKAQVAEMIADREHLQETLTRKLAPHTGVFEGDITYRENGESKILVSLVGSVTYDPMQEKFYDPIIYTSPIQRPPIMMVTTVQKTPWWAKGLIAAGSVVTVLSVQGENWLAAGAAGALTGVLVVIEL